MGGKRPVIRSFSGRTDADLISLLDEPTGWVLLGPRRKVLEQADSLRIALDKTNVRTVACIHRLPENDVIIFRDQVVRLLKQLRMEPDAETVRWSDW